MPPERLETAEAPKGGRTRRVEQLAENFAAAVLMPEDLLRERWESRDRSADLHEWLNATAEDLRVSAVAGKWRCHNLGLLSRADLLDINDQRLIANGRPSDAAALPRQFSERFVSRVAGGIDAGRLSVRRAASLIGCSLAELADLLTDYGIAPSFEA